MLCSIATKCLVSLLLLFVVATAVADGRCTFCGVYGNTVHAAIICPSCSKDKGGNQTCCDFCGKNGGNTLQYAYICHKCTKDKGDNSNTCDWCGSRSSWNHRAKICSSCRR